VIKSGVWSKSRTKKSHGTPQNLYVRMILKRYYDRRLWIGLCRHRVGTKCAVCIYEYNSASWKVTLRRKTDWLIRRNSVEQLEESTWHRTSFTSLFIVLLHLMSGVITEVLQLESKIRFINQTENPKRNSLLWHLWYHPSHNIGFRKIYLIDLLQYPLEGDL